MLFCIVFLKLINYSPSSYPTRASYSGQVDGFRNDFNLHIHKATKTRGDKQLYLITHFTKQTLNLNYLLLMLNVTVQLLNYPKQKKPFFFSKFKFLLNGGDLVFWFTFNLAKMALTLEILSD